MRRHFAPARLKNPRHPPLKSAQRPQVRHPGVQRLHRFPPTPTRTVLQRQRRRNFLKGAPLLYSRAARCASRRAKRRAERRCGVQSVFSKTMRFLFRRVFYLRPNRSAFRRLQKPRRGCRIHRAAFAPFSARCPERREYCRPYRRSAKACRA